MKLDAEIIQSLTKIAESDWNRLGEADYPFTRHEFLLAMEQHHCLYEFGWQPVYLLLREGGILLAAIPCYIKTNSYGELVFDHSWAQSYERSGLSYYPKLVSAIPYTPATGPRFLINRQVTDKNLSKQLKNELLRLIKQFCQSQNLSSWHLLFERESVAKGLAEGQLLYRYDCQFHWFNQDYQSFDDFLHRLNSRKRKNIRKERSAIANENIEIEQHFGNEITDAQWKRVYELYRGIFDRKYGAPTLTEGFFHKIGSALKERVMVVLVKKQQQIIATSLFFVSDTTLFGRVWGCDEYHKHLHFECCYYQGIDFCIKNKLQVFDPGAQGEHKISRGFLPIRTCSAHWFSNLDFHQILKRHLDYEKMAIEEYQLALMKRSPYKNDTP